ncbi:mdm2-binding protein isoform X2 [Bombina bombina]|uniref:mdm2-binding protein isoform X2 n=1 Tax=Bombina bombina TaxID=8345 RepID=UPI00235AB843|nr:mdm2-binding protein isoform X2 [Bombina bombina]
MERFVLVINWERRLDNSGDTQQIPAGLAHAQNIYTQLKEYCLKNTNTFPACSLSGNPAPRKWFFAVQTIYGSFQFSSPDWEELCPAAQPEDSEEVAQTAVEECLSALHNTDDEEDDSRDSVLQTNLYEETAESLHQLSDKLPAPGRALVDVILLAPDVPKLKDCALAVGAIKHLKEWHSAKITIYSKECKGWQKIAHFLSAGVVNYENPEALIDPEELWRGSVEISETKFSSDVEFPEFCIRSTTEGSSQASYLRLSTTLKSHVDKTKAALPEVFHYFGSSLEFVQMVMLSELPSYFISNCMFELLTRNSLQGKSKLMLDQLCSLNEKVGAIFMLPCNVCSLPIPPALQRSTRKWKEYMSRKPKVIKVPGTELKGEYCSYYFLIQYKDSGVCKATLLHSASQINGAASLVLLHRKLNNKQEEQHKFNEEIPLDSVPHFHGDQIILREKTLAQTQALAVKEYLKRLEITPHTAPNVNALKTLLALTRDHVFGICENHINNNCKLSLNTSLSGTVATDTEITELNPSEWPERNVLQNLENFEKIKQRIRASILSSSAEQLLGRKDGQKEGMTLLDAKELLKYFTPQGLAIGDLQPLQVQRGDNAFLLTPKLTPRKLKGLPFEEASECHYHGLEYCLDNRKALERDVSFSELQSRLIRYETQTTCTRECCPIPFALSPIPSPAVISEPGSVPDGESLQTEPRADPLRLKRRSKELDVLFASKRLMKSDSSDSLLSLPSESSTLSLRSTRARPEKSDSSLSSQPSSSQLQSSKSSQQNKRLPQEQENKESRSQKHNRMLKEVVSRTLEKHGVGSSHPCYAACSQRLFDISKFFLKDLKTSRGLLDEMKKAASNNAKQVIQWELDKLKKK